MVNVEQAMTRRTTESSVVHTVKLLYSRNSEVMRTLSICQLRDCRLLESVAKESSNLPKRDFERDEVTVCTITHELRFAENFEDHTAR